MSQSAAVSRSKQMCLQQPFKLSHCRRWAGSLFHRCGPAFSIFHLQITIIVYNVCNQKAECDMLVGVLQSAALVLVDAHSSRLVSVTDDNTTVTAAVTSSRLIDSDGRAIEPDVPFWLFSLHRYLSALSTVSSTALYTVNLSLYVVSFSLKFSLTSEFLSSEFCRLFLSVCICETWRGVC